MAKQEVKKYVVCPRCKGAGGFDAYLHVWNGTCFECSGYKKVKTPLYEKYTEAKAFLKHTPEMVEGFDKELENLNARMERSASERNGFIHSNAWKRVDDVEKRIEEARAFWRESERLVFHLDSTTIFID